MKFRTQATSIFFFAFMVPVFGLLAYSGSFNLGVMAGGPVSPPVTSPVTPPGSTPTPSPTPTPTPTPVTPPTFPTPTPSPSPMPSVSPFPSPSPRPSASPTPMPSPVPTPVPSPSPRPTPTPPPMCKVVRGDVTLFKISRNNNQAKLYFTPASNTLEYKISYGYKVGETRFIKIAKPVNNNMGIQTVVIKNLVPGKRYAFQVTPTNACSEGKPSNWLVSTQNKTVKL